MKMPSFNMGDVVITDDAFGIVISTVVGSYYNKETNGWHYWLNGNARRYRQEELALYFREGFKEKYKIRD